MSAAKRVAHAAETVRARWVQQVSTDPQTEAAQALEDSGQLLDPEVAAELVAFRKERELAEAVAEYGALPMPVGPVPQELSAERLAEIAESHPGDWYSGEWRSEDYSAGEFSEYIVKHVESDTVLAELPDWAGPLALFFADAHDAVPELVAEVRRLRAQVAALLEERHSTNESVSEAAEALRVQRDRIAELETGIAWRDAERDRWAGVRYLVEKAIDKGWSGVDTIDLESELGPEPAPVPAESVAEPSCPCPPADQPGPHQLGCPLAEVPRPSLREVLDGEHWTTVHHDYRPGLGRDLPVPESCRLDAAGLDEVGQRFLGGGA